jgi:hypothetical protein
MTLPKSTEDWPEDWQHNLLEREGMMLGCVPEDDPPNVEEIKKKAEKSTLVSEEEEALQFSYSASPQSG